MRVSESQTLESCPADLSTTVANTVEIFEKNFEQVL